MWARTKLHGYGGKQQNGFLFRRLFEFECNDGCAVSVYNRVRCSWHCSVIAGAKYVVSTWRVSTLVKECLKGICLERCIETTADGVKKVYSDFFTQPYSLYVKEKKKFSFFLNRNSVSEWEKLLCSILEKILCPLDWYDKKSTQFLNWLKSVGFYFNMRYFTSGVIKIVFSLFKGTSTIGFLSLTGK